MSTVYLNREMPEPDRRASLFAGDFHVLTAFPAAVALADRAKAWIAETFGEIPPAQAASILDVPAFVDRVAPLKSRFTNAPETKALCQALVVALGADPDDTYFDLPRLRAIPPSDWLATGVSYNYKAHRDTWYAHPRCLVNLWAPVFDVVGENVMSMFPRYFGRAVANDSEGFDYDTWVRESRFKAAEQVGKEERPHPVPLEPVDTEGEIRFAGRSGDLLMFSTCQLHASAPNTSGVVRYSFDLRIVSLEDVLRGHGPPNVDSRATGTTLGDFLRVSDLRPFDVTAIPG